MIDVKSTIFKTINNTFDKMRLLGRNDPKLLKKILYLIVLDDIYDWSDYIDENQSIQKRLQELRTRFIQCNPEFTICRFPFDQHYVNVNTPQTNYTWKRVWDSQNVIVIDNVSKYINLTELTEFKEIDGKIYSYSEITSITDDGYLQITEKNINDDGYLIE